MKRSSPIAPLSGEAALRRKCRQSFAAHRKIAARDFVKLDYGPADLIDLARASPTCFYCRSPLSFGFQFDHRTPIARTPQAHKLANLAVSCSGCNLAKGQMDAEEFARLLQLLGGFHPSASADALARLRAGGSRYSRSRGTPERL